MPTRRSSLTGSWSGAYRYPRGAGPETVFNVQIEEVAGAFTGAMQEPNLTRPGAGTVANAEIEGTRNGASVNFIKFYKNSGGMDHALRYEGEVNEALTRITGTWTIPNVWSGTFFMTRDDDGAEEAVEREAEAPIKIRR